MLRMMMSRGRTRMKLEEEDDDTEEEEDWPNKNLRYPLVNIQKTMEHHHV